jgi:DNA-binding response OmpR family regulator
MTTRPTVLVLEDSRSEREQLTTLLNGLGLAVSATDSPVTARRILARTPDLDLAVIDWDMSRSTDVDTEPTSQKVLEILAGSARETLTIVYARNLMRTAVTDAIMRAHPAALLHDKRHGLQSLEKRLIQLLSPRVGDLALDERYRSFVQHLPSGQRFKHRAAFRLLTNYPRDVMFQRDSRGMQAGLTRFRRWLEENQSSVSVASLGMGTHRYRLEVREETRAHHQRRTG